MNLHSAVISQRVQRPCGSLDPSRLIHYEGDFEAEAVTSTPPCPPGWKSWRRSAAGEKGESVNPTSCVNTVILMGNGAGCLKVPGCVPEISKRSQGGFIWEWYDHGFFTKDEEGHEYYRYGGTMGISNNGNSVSTVF